MRNISGSMLDPLTALDQAEIHSRRENIKSYRYRFLLI